MYVNLIKLLFMVYNYYIILIKNYITLPRSSAMQNWEALKAVREGKKVTNKNLVPESFITIDNGELIIGFMNSQMKVKSFGNEFVNHSDNWMIVGEKKESVH